MDLALWEPFDGFDRLRSQMHQFFDEAFGHVHTYPSLTAGTWRPAVDILESGDAYLIRAELPGMKREDIRLEFRDGAVWLSGEKKFEEPADGVEYHRSERPSGRFSRSFYLPQSVKHEDMKATYRDGILEIHVPKADEAKAKQIAITVN